MGVAVSVRLMVLVTEKVAETDAEVVGVSLLLADELAETDALTESVAETLGLVLALLLPEMLMVLVAVLVLVRLSVLVGDSVLGLGVGELFLEALAVLVLVLLMVGVLVLVLDSLGLIECDLDLVAEKDLEAVSDSVAEGELEPLSDSLALALALTLGVDEALSEGDWLLESDMEALLEGVMVAVRVICLALVRSAVRVSEMVEVNDGVDVKDLVGVGLSLSPGVTDGSSDSLALLLTGVLVRVLVTLFVLVMERD